MMFVPYFCFCCFVALLSATTINYALSLVSVVMFYVYYTHTDGCTENKAFISVNMLLCVGASIMSILPKIQVTALRFAWCKNNTVYYEWW